MYDNNYFWCSIFLFSGILLLAEGQTDIAESRALDYRDDIIAIYSNSWGPPDDGFSVGRPGTLAEFTFGRAALTVRHTCYCNFNRSRLLQLRVSNKVHTRCFARDYGCRELTNYNQK